MYLNICYNNVFNIVSFIYDELMKYIYIYIYIYIYTVKPLYKKLFFFSNFFLIERFSYKRFLLFR